MHPRLKPVNALLSLCIPGDLNPPVLHDAGFRVAGLEVPVRTEYGNVTIDVLLCHDATSHLTACESKSGSNIEDDQARKYAALDPHAVRDAGSVSLPTRTPPTIEVLYLCLEAHATRVLHGLSAAGLQVPVLAVAGGSVDLLARQHASPLLLRAFADAPIRLPAGIARHITFDEESTVEELRPAVRAELTTLQSHRITERTVRAITEQTLPRLAIYGAKTRGTLGRKVAEVVRAIAKDEPGTFAFQPHTGTHEAHVRILRTPEDNDPRGRTQAWQANGRARSTTRRGTDRNPDQMDLLQELDVADDVSGDSDIDIDREAGA